LKSNLIVRTRLAEEKVFLADELGPARKQEGIARIESKDVSSLFPIPELFEMVIIEGRPPFHFRVDCFNNCQLPLTASWSAPVLGIGTLTRMGPLLEFLP
jgi:hypothetical protein